MSLQIFTGKKTKDDSDNSPIKDVTGLFLKSPVDETLSYDKLSPMVNRENQRSLFEKTFKEASETGSGAAFARTERPYLEAEMSSFGTTPVAVKAPWAIQTSAAFRPPVFPARTSSSNTLVDDSRSPVSPLVLSGKTPMRNTALKKKTPNCDSDGPVFCLWNTTGGQCRAIFSSYDLLWNHITQEHIGYARLGTICLKCHWDNCTEPPKRKRDHMLSHMRSHLPNYRPFVCPLCHEGRHRYHELNKHMLKLHGISAKDTVLPQQRKRTFSHEPFGVGLMPNTWEAFGASKRTRSVSFHPYSTAPLLKQTSSADMYDILSHDIQQHAPTPQITPRMDMVNQVDSQQMMLNADYKFERMRRYSSSTCVQPTHVIESSQPLSLFSNATVPAQIDTLPSPTPSMLPEESNFRSNFNSHQRSKSFNHLKFDSFSLGLLPELSTLRTLDIQSPSGLSPSTVSPLLFLGQEKSLF